ncbi:MAG: FAD-dependent oxidoreductase [Coxiellaceae bacterium]|jgi:NADPH-dependent glutamate synthase beta subunit-like oxidoreductase|nr:FAD-dependent oxidoreductase [Coxiellaceae bacterium]
MINKSRKVAVCVKKTPPCNNICPAGEDIQHWLNLAKEQKYHEAWQVILQSNPFPAIHGRVCYHYCETRCNRIQHDSTVGIHCIERFLGDMALREKWAAPALNTNTKKEILIVGAGPAGLTAAYYLRLFGYNVTIYESLPQAGGMMLIGIPAYRLPREILFGEINRVLNTGIKIEYNHKVQDVIKEKDDHGFDAVFLAIGAHLGKDIAIQIEDPCIVMDAIDYLRGIALGRSTALGSRLVVYGGGNTAIDVARSAKRLGVSDVNIVYHRTRERMSAFNREIEAALAEGIKFTFLRSIIALNHNTLTLSINEIDNKGRPKNTGKIETLEIDALIFALGQIPDSEFLRKIPEVGLQPAGVITIDDLFITGYRGIFAGGDMIPFDRSITAAVGHGRRAAYCIDSYLGHTHTSFGELPFSKELASFDKLHISDEKSQKTMEKMLQAGTRVKSFSEVIPSCTQNEVLYESKRCFSCGNCFGCGKCYAVCPVTAITHSKLDGKVTEINPAKCIDCSQCFKICPCGAINMIDRK